MKRIFRFLGVAMIVVGIMAISHVAQADTAYFRDLALRKVTYLSDGCYSVCLLLGVADRYSNFESQKNFLKEQGILPEKAINAGANEPLRKSAAAYMFCRALDIKGGAVMRVFGPSERYALRELIYKQLVAEGPAKKIVSGMELLSILMRASEYKNKEVLVK